MFEKFLKLMQRVEQDFPTIKRSFRGLSGIDSFAKLKQPDELLTQAKKVWLSAIGFGVDGATPEVRKSIRKNQNYNKSSENPLEKSIQVIKKTYEHGITPEILMVFGHPGETAETLETAYTFCEDMYEHYEAIPRPHISKHILPGNDQRYKPENKKLVEFFVNNPEYFQFLDYPALASESTHPDKKLRKLANHRYIKICNLTPQATQYIIPNTPEYQKKAKADWTTVEALNQGKFDR